MKKILSGQDLRNVLTNGAKKTAKIVGATMGARGRTVILSGGWETMPAVTKDGVTITHHITLESELENPACMLLRNAANKTVIQAGDGTTATVVLAAAMIEEGLKKISDGVESQSIKRGMDKAVNAVVKHLEADSEEIDFKKLLNIATISANNDSVLGELIEDAYKNIGVNGLLSVEMGKKPKTYTDIVQGFQFNRGLKDPCFITDSKKGQAIYKDPIVLVCNYELSEYKSLEKAFEMMSQLKRPMILIANEFSGEVAGLLVVNRQKFNMPIVAVKAPNTYQRELLDDLCTITGATLISDDRGLKLEDIKEEHLGTCTGFVSGKDSTSIIKGGGSKEEVEKRAEEIKVMIKQEDDRLVVEVHEKRLAALSGSVGVIYVGAPTDAELKEKYDRVEDAVKAVESAVAEGVSPGGGVALLECIDILKEVDCINSGEEVGVDVIRKSLEAPIRQILKNAGVYRSPLLRKVYQYFNIREENDILKTIKNSSKGTGFDVKNLIFVDMKKEGILDPTKVIRVALQNASSVAGSCITSDSMVVTMLDKK